MYLCKSSGYIFDSRSSFSERLATNEEPCSISAHDHASMCEYFQVCTHDHSPDLSVLISTSIVMSRCRTGLSHRVENTRNLVIVDFGSTTKGVRSFSCASFSMTNLWWALSAYCFASNSPSQEKISKAPSIGKDGYRTTARISSILPGLAPAFVKLSVVATCGMNQLSSSLVIACRRRCIGPAVVINLKGASCVRHKVVPDTTNASTEITIDTIESKTPPCCRLDIPHASTYRAETLDSRAGHDRFPCKRSGRCCWPPGAFVLDYDRRSCRINYRRWRRLSK